MPLTPYEIEDISSSVEPYFPCHVDAFVNALRDMLSTAEKVFGGRDYGYSVAAVQFAGDRPRVKSLTGYRRRLVIYLSLNAGEDIQQAEDFHLAFWQLSHETVHLLSQTEGEYATVLEEGLACYYQVEYMTQRQHFWWKPTQWPDSYANAYLMAHELLQWDRDVIKRMRRVQPVISLMTPQLILEHCPQASPHLAAALTKRFNRDETDTSFLPP